MTRSPRSPWIRRLAIAAGLLAAVIVAGMLLADRLLLSRAKAAAADLSRAWGRPVEIEGISTKVVPWLGVRVTGVRIGGASDEGGRPLLELGRAEVRLNLAGALLSRGKDVEVRLAELEGLRLNVLRLADGTTNLERLARAAAPPEAAPPREEAPPRDLSFLRVDRASVMGARIAFLDLARAGAKELFVDHLDVVVQDLRAGRPLDVTVRAAVLAATQNLELHLHTAPLPATLRPTPDQVTLKLAPVDLDPLAPFLPAGIGFLGGHLQADLEVTLGSAVPGGTGATRLRGGFTARGLRFAGQEGGKPLDVALDADVDGDVDQGSVRMRKLLLTAGPASVTGSGSASGLAGGAPRVEGLRLTAKGLDPRSLAAYYPPLRKSLGETVSGPIGLDLRAAGDTASPALEARADLTPVRLAFPGKLSKAPGAPLVATARASFSGGVTRVAIHADLSGVDLRPGGSVAKAPGERLALDADLERRAAGRSQTVQVKRLDLLLPADAITARGGLSVSEEKGARAVRFELAAESARLDLDRLLLPAPPAAKGSGKGSGKKEAPPSPAAFAGLSGTALVKVAELRYSKATFKDVRVRLRLDGDDLRVEEARLTGLGGRVSADGTRVRLAHPQEPARLLVKLDGVDAGEALAMFTPRKLLSGRVSAQIDLSAGAAGRRELLQSLAGSLAGNLAGGSFLGKDLVAGVLGPLGKALPFTAVRNAAEGGATPLGKELPFSVHFDGGAGRLTKPLRFGTGRAVVSTEGGQVRLDGTLDVPVTVALSPDTISTLTGGRARPAEPVPVSLRVTGPAWSPRLGDLALQPAVAAIVKSAGSAAVSRALGVNGEKALAGKKAAAEEGARKAAEDAKKKASDEAKKALHGLFGR